ncbi:MAG: HAD family hydrolase [Ruminococcus sp.]|nr:HAD family hydrolase [Ruminococcus sp.]
MIKGIIFDMDGRMFDTEKLLVKFWCQAANEHGFDMKQEHVLGIRSLSRKYAIPHLKSIFGDNFDFESIRARRISLMNDYIDKNGFEIKKGLFKLLDYLKEHNYKIAVATATDLERATIYLKKAKVFDYFDEIICGDMIKNGKPDPDIYIKAVEKLNLTADECLALEDSPNGIKSAYNAGCKIIMVPDLSPADETVNKMVLCDAESLDKVINVLEEQNGNKCI